MGRDPVLQRLDDVVFSIAVSPRLVLEHGLEAAWVLASLNRWVTGMMPILLSQEEGHRGELTVNMDYGQAQVYLGCEPAEYGVLLARMNAIGLPVFNIEANSERLRFTIYDPDNLIADDRSKQMAHSVGVRR